MLVTDLDGTLLDSSGCLRAEEHGTLLELAARGVLRVVATGRNLHSARHVMTPDFPVDYLVFASGAGIMDWREQRLLAASSLAAEEVQRARDCLMDLELDFMLHHAVPDNHRFHWFSHGRPNADFDRRRARYSDFAEAWTPGCEDGRVVSLLAEVDGHAVLDFDGDGEPESEELLTAWGVTPEELAFLAETRDAGQSVWRVPTRHFSTVYRRRICATRSGAMVMARP